MSKQTGSDSPINTCIAGIGGFGRAHHTAVHSLEQESIYRVLATCDPRHRELGEITDSFALKERGISIFADFEEMIERFSGRSQLLTIATPIHLHATMHRTAGEHDMGCYLEKPPTLNPEELERMIAADQGRHFETEVGFNYISEKWRQNLKSRILAGEFGVLLDASFFGAWKRDSDYYNRSPWAGRLTLNGDLVLDSCFGNAMSHHVHNLLFFAGRDGLFSWADVAEVQSELYRANSIEGSDTVFSKMITGDGVELRVAMSHACESKQSSLEIVRCQLAEIHIRPYQSVKIFHSSRQTEQWTLASNEDLLQLSLRHYAAYLQGRVSRPLTRLADCRPLVAWNALNYIAARKIHTIPESAYSRNISPGTEVESLTVADMESVMHAFVRNGIFPFKQGVLWAEQGGCASIDELSGLELAVAGMTDEAFAS